MPTGQFSVERPTVSAASAHVEDVHGQITGLMSNLTNRLQAVLADRQVWQGDAQVRFVGVHQQWDDATRRINQALADIGMQLRRSEQQYGDADAQNSTIVGGSAGALA